MKFAVESWSPEYGVSADETQMDASSSTVDVAIECAEQDWGPITPPVGTAPDRVLFIDGVRRVDARIWFPDGQLTRPGVCASVAAGAVLCTAGSAVVQDVQIRRGFFARDAAEAGPIALNERDVYEYFVCAGDSPEEIYLGIHEQMTACEARVAAAVDADLVVYDGPLRGRSDARAIGYVKTQHVQYLPDAQQAILGVLAPGDRTPVFLIGGVGRGARYSWYLRLPGKQSQPMSGIVRIEMSAVGDVPGAIERANLVTSVLPRFASEPHKDARAPQNLYPIAGLEHRLRHLLGDTQILERLLRRAAARPDSPASV